MSDELKSTQIYYGENVLMMRVDDCLIFGNKDALRRLAEKLKERTAHWIEDEYAFNHSSSCGFEFDSPEETADVCPSCGAYMKGE